MNKNVLLISIDSVRPEAIGPYPEHFSLEDTFPYKVDTPTLDVLAADGALFTKLITQAPYTPASHASFLTGLNPPGHAVRGFFGYRLSERAETLAQRLQREGYRTSAFVGSDALNPRYGLDRGFEVYDAQFERKIGGWPRGDHRRAGSETTQRALKWLRQAGRPFLVFVHYFDVHEVAEHVYLQSDRLARWLRKGRSTRLARGPVRRWLQRLETGYANCRQRGKPFHVRQTQRVDKQIGLLVRGLEEQGAYDDTIIVVMSDHGEAFGEHGEFGHRQYLYDTTLSVPLILKALPDYRGRTIDTPIRSIDLVPTLYDLLGLDRHPSNGCKPVEGASLLPLLHGTNGDQREAYSETSLERSLKQVNELKYHFVSMRTPRWKLIVNMLDGSRELYDVVRDPNETQNVAARRADVAERLSARAMRTYESGGESPPDVSGYTDRQLEEVETRLRDLGYA